MYLKENIMKKLFIAFIIGLFAAPLTLADTTSDVLTELETAGIQYVYVISKKPALENLRILKTKETADTVDMVVASGILDELSANVEVVTLADTFEQATAQRKLEERRRKRQED